MLIHPHLFDKPQISHQLRNTGNDGESARLTYPTTQSTISWTREALTCSENYSSRRKGQVGIVLLALPIPVRYVPAPFQRLLLVLALLVPLLLFLTQMIQPEIGINTLKTKSTPCLKHTYPMHHYPRK